jgi:hypothetical protein
MESQRWRLIVGVGVAAVLAGVLSSCGGGGSLAPSSDLASGGPEQPANDGKPDPALAPPSEMQTQAVATLLRVGTDAVHGKVGYNRTVWYECQMQAGSTYIVRLSPWASDQDCDLYLYSPAAAGGQRLGMSRRGHSANSVASVDWLAVTPTVTGRHLIGIHGYGPPTPGTVIDYWVEADALRFLAVDGGQKGGTLPIGSSRPYYFNAVTGRKYRVAMETTSGQPLTIVYGNTCNKYLDWTDQFESGSDAVEFTAAASGRHHVVVCGHQAGGNSYKVSVESVDAGLTQLFFLHHSTGSGIISQGDVRGEVARYNTAHHQHYSFWDHGYNSEGLSDALGVSVGDDYGIPNDNTDPDGLHYLWTSAKSDAVACRNQILEHHQVIAFKSCFPASAITSAAALQQYKDWYLDIRDVLDTRPDRLFVVMSTPPLHRLATNAADASRARAFANWLQSATYLSGHPNVVCFDLFDLLAKADDGSAAANMLAYAHEASHSDSDSHPNLVANQVVGPLFAQFLCDAAGAYTPPTTLRVAAWQPWLEPGK